MCKMPTFRKSNKGINKRAIKKLPFYIENKNKNNDKYISNGYIEEYKMPKKLKFNSFKDNFLIPNNNYINIDAKKIQIYYYIALL